MRYAVNLDQGKDLSLVRFDRSTQWPPTSKWPPFEDKRPSCTKRTCMLPNNNLPVNDFPPELNMMRKRLAKAAAAPECLPGWLVDARPLEIQAYAPGHRASFHVSTAKSQA